MQAGLLHCGVTSGQVEAAQYTMQIKAAERKINTVDDMLRTTTGYM